MAKSIPFALRDRLWAKIGALGDIPDGVWRRTGALNTWGTNAIEGNTLTQEEVQSILLAGESIAGRPVPDVLETIQHDRAFRGLLARLDDRITLLTVLGLHEEVFRGSPRHRPGEWRRSNVYIAGSAHRPPASTKVVSKMQEWESLAQTTMGPDPFPFAARLQQAFEEIHPLEDGNGRVGRLLLNLHLMQHGWPPLHVTPEDRVAYLDALAAGNRGDHAPLAALLRAAMVRSLLDLLDQVGDEQDRLRPLRELAANPWCPHDAAYLALRCRQGTLAGLHVTHTAAPAAAKSHRGRPRWLSSEFALRHYLAEMASGRD